MSSNSHAGRPGSWVAVSVIMAGFVVGGVAVPMGPNWLLFWVGAAIIVVGGVLALFLDVMSDVVLDERRQ
jgi:hypothetical protein